jgi:hypothetical protein
MVTFKSLFSFVWKLIKNEPLLLAPSIAFFYALSIIQAQYLPILSLEKMPTTHEAIMLAGIVVADCIVILMTTVMVKEFVDTTRITFKNVILKTLTSAWKLVYASILIVIPPYLVLLGILWGFGESEVMSYLGQAAIIILFLNLMIILQFLPIAALDGETSWARFPIRIVQKIWKNIRIVMFFTVWLYFLKFIGFAISTIVGLIPQIGESVLLAFARGFMQGLSSLLVALFWILAIQDSDKSTVSQTV